MKKFIVYLSLFFFVLLIPNLSAGQSKNKHDLEIIKAHVDLENNYIWIYGNNLRFFSAVLLEGEPLTVISAGETLVVAYFEVEPEPGTYRLDVYDSSYPNPPSMRIDTMDVTIGAVGLQGEAGPEHSQYSPYVQLFKID